MLGTLVRCALPMWTLATRPPVSAAAIARAQRRILIRLLERHAALPAGRRLGYARILASVDPVAAFRAAVAPSDYADWSDLIERSADGEADALVRGRALALAQTSGTTRGASAGERWIPQDAALLRHHRRGGSTALARLLTTIGPDALDGRLLMLGGTTSLERRRRVACG